MGRLYYIELKFKLVPTLILSLIPMAPHIVSWGANSPATSTAPSVVSFDSSSDVHPGPGATEKGTNSVNISTGEPSGTLTPTSTYPGVDDSFQRHNTYFFKDGNITFLVDGTLYCVHRFFFSRDSAYFSTRLAQLGTRDHEALTTLVSLGDVEREDFEALLSVIYPKDFEEHSLSYRQWKSVLHLSTRWGFASIRRLALKSINPPTPHDRLILARTYTVDQWVQPALTTLCERAEPLSLTEALQMRMEDVVLVAAVREDVRSRVLRIDGAKVARVVEAALAGKQNEGSSASRASPEGGAAKQGTGSTTAASPVGAESPNFFPKGKGVAKSPEENATQAVGSAAGPAQGAPKREGERDPKPSPELQAAFDSAFSPPTASMTTPKQKPGELGASNGQNSFASAEKSSTSTHKNPSFSSFSFGPGFGSGMRLAPLLHPCLVRRFAKKGLFLPAQSPL
ncbi:hypothetical protein EDB92DRAFT_1540415 [Lactarius akahatsu]|uniref:BTB domain-containing protein n=1 Tax=Lactarius akahatsu TaxID=416441 RepID=A0AAD4QDM1_9AGAM|nr:hypothetical protein EDB92DRAFT_1540415 [Lactarius akahatsu]